MKKWLFFGLFFFYIIKIYAQDFTLNSGKITQKEFFEEISFELEHEKIVIPISIAGKSYRFLLDTGAPNVVSKSLANILYSSDKKELDVYDSNNLNKKMEMIPLPEMKLGSLLFKDGAAIVADLDNHFFLKCYKLDGFVGSNFFKNAVLQVDYKAQKIRISNTIKSFSPQSKGKSMKLIGPQIAPYITLKHENEIGYTASEQVLLDTGMDGLYDMSNRVYNTFQKGGIVQTLSESNGISGMGLFEKIEPTAHRLIKLHKIQLNNTSFIGLVTETMDDDNSRIGLNAFQYGKVTLDFDKKKWYYEASNVIEVSQKKSIISQTFIDQKFVVGNIWDDAYKSKLQFGNRILRIDKFYLENLTVCAILDIKKHIKTLSSYEIDILNDSGETVTIKINNL